MPLTLREALATVEPLRNSRVVAGERGLDKIIQYVNVMEVPDILDWVHPGELLVTTMYPLRDNAAEIEQLIPRLHAKGLVGLAVNPLAYINEFPECMVEAANALGFPLIQLPDKVSFIDIIQPLTSRILALQANELIQSGNIHRQFIDLVLGGGGYSDIAQGVAQLVKHPVSIVDRFRRVIGNGFVIDQMHVPKWFIRDDATGDSYLTDQYKPELLGALSSAAQRMVVTGPAGKVEHIVCPVKVGAMTLGQIIVWGALDQPQASVELMAIEHGSTVTALKMMERRSIEGVEQRFRNEILEGLLSKEPTARERASVLARELGYHLTPPFAVILVGPDLPPGARLPKAEQLEQSNFDSSLHLAMRYIRALRAHAVFWYEGSRLVIFFPLQTGEVAGAKDFLGGELGKVCARIAAENHPYTVSIGISNAATELMQFREAYDCAKQSLQIGRVFQAQPRSVVTHYEDLGIFRIISLTESPASIERFCHDTLGAVLTYDRQNGTELVETLRVFLEQNQNLAQAAKVLNVHYNTLRYRLDRIKELLGDALERPHQRLTIEVALHLYALQTRN